MWEELNCIMDIHQEAGDLVYLAHKIDLNYFFIWAVCMVLKEKTQG